VQDPLLPTTATGQLREHRLYQADWLLRFYGFTVEELLTEQENLSMEFDPKCAWALKNMHLFPVEVNHAPLEILLRVPGIGAKNAYKIIEARKYTKLTFESLTKMRVALKRAKHFITCNGKFFGAKNEEAVRGFLAQAEEKDSAVQLDLFSLLSTPQNAMIALNGQL
jgi:predicted DNA-binding helix-hairpin-helix protein